MSTADAGPRHLVVVHHGLDGSAAENFPLISALLGQSVFATTLGALQSLVGQSKENSRYFRADDLLVHNVQCNSLSNKLLAHWAETRLGVDKCGEQAAEEIRAAVAEYPSLEWISLIGISLGGLVARYAAADGYDSDTKTVFSLRPRKYVSLATPHLGVTDHWEIAQTIVRNLKGATGTQLLLEDDDRLLAAMAAADGPFVRALAEFDERVVYGNLHNDLMVSYDTATILGGAVAPDSSETGAGKHVSAVHRDAAWADRVPEHESRAVLEMASGLRTLAWTRVDVDLGVRWSSLKHVQENLWDIINMHAHISIVISDEVLEHVRGTIAGGGEDEQ